MSSNTRITIDPLDLTIIDDLLALEAKTVRSSVRQMCGE